MAARGGPSAAYLAARDARIWRERHESAERQLEDVRGDLERHKAASTFALKAAERQIADHSVQIVTLENELADARAAVRGLARTLAEEVSSCR